MNHNERLANIDASILDAVVQAPQVHLEPTPASLMEQLDIVKGGVSMLEDGGVSDDALALLHSLFAACIRITRKVDERAHDIGILKFDRDIARELVEVLTGQDADEAIDDYTYFVYEAE